MKRKIEASQSGVVELKAELFKKSHAASSSANTALPTAITSGKKFKINKNNKSSKTKKKVSEHFKPKASDADELLSSELTLSWITLQRKAKEYDQLKKKQQGI